MKLASETKVAANSVDDRFDLVDIHNSKWQQWSGAVFNTCYNELYILDIPIPSCE